MTTAVMNRAAGQPVIRTGTSPIQLYLPVVLFYAILMPAGIFTSVGGFLVYPYRAVLIASLPWLAVQYYQRRPKPALGDLLIIAGCSWFAISLIVNMGTADGIQSAGREIIDLMGSYFVGRATIRSVDDVKRLLNLLLPGLVLVGAILMIESVSHRLLIWPLFPSGANPNSLFQIRAGLMRAWGPFNYPILGGIFMGSWLPLYYAYRRGTLSWAIGIIAACSCIFTMSSGAFLLLIVMIAGLLFVGTSRLVFGRTRWVLLLAPLALAMFYAQIFTESGAARFFIRNFALDPATGYFRILIWDFGSQSVANHPWFGIAYEAYDRLAWMKTSSVDNYWLLLAMRFGLPAAIAINVAVLYAIWSAARAGRIAMRKDNAILLGLAISLTGIWLSAWTVAIWLSVLAGFMFMVGAAISLRMSAERDWTVLHATLRQRLREQRAAATHTPLPTQGDGET